LSAFGHERKPPSQKRFLDRERLELPILLEANREIEKFGMNEQVAVALLSVMVGFFSVGFAGASFFYSRSQMKMHELRVKHATTLDFHRIGMSDVYHARTIAGIYFASSRGKTQIPFSDVHRDNPEASESIGRVMHFIVEMLAADRAGLLDNGLARSLFRSTFSEWKDNLSLFVFSDTLFHDDFRRSIKDAVKV
jgi:hypothetical protein